MSVPLILRDKQIVLSASASELSISFDNNRYTCGTIEEVSPLCEFAVIGDSVFYLDEGSIGFSYLDEHYILSSEDKIIFKEDNPL